MIAAPAANKPVTRLSLCIILLRALKVLLLSNFRIDLFFYAILPFAIMVICSLTIIVNILKSTKHLTNLRLAQHRIARNKQLFFILLATNGLFICLVSPLVLLNAMGMIEEGTRLTTTAYILAYANHG